MKDRQIRERQYHWKSNITQWITICLSQCAIKGRTNRVSTHCSQPSLLKWHVIDNTGDGIHLLYLYKSISDRIDWYHLIFRGKVASFPDHSQSSIDWQCLVNHRSLLVESVNFLYLFALNMMLVIMCFLRLFTSIFLLSSLISSPNFCYIL